MALLVVIAVEVVAVVAAPVGRAYVNVGVGALRLLILMLVAVVANLWLRPKRKRGYALDIQGGCMMVRLYVGYQLKQAGVF